MCAFHDSLPVETASDFQPAQVPSTADTTSKDEVLAYLKRQGIYSVSTKTIAEAVGIPQASVRRIIGELGDKVETRFRTREGKWVRLKQAE